MKGAIFNANNKYGDIFEYDTTGTSVYVETTFSDNPPAVNDRILVGISGYTTSFSGGNIYTYTGLPSGVNKRVQIKTNKIGELGRSIFTIGGTGTGIIGSLDFSRWSKMENTFRVANSPGVNSILMPNPWSGTTSTSYQMSGDIVIVDTGVSNVDLSQFIRYRDLDIYNNPSLTGFTFPNLFSLGRFHNLYNNNLQGNLDLSTLTGVQSRYTFLFYSNPGLTGVTLPSIGPRISGTIANPAVYGFSCNIQGNLDLSPLVGFPVYCSFTNNSITGITFPTYAQMITGPNSVITNGIGLFDFSNNNLIGNLDMSMFKKMYNIIRMDNNPNLTGVTFSLTGTNNFNEIRIDNCNLTGNLDLSTLSGNLGGIFDINSNTNLTGITFSSTNNMTTSGSFPRFYIHSCGLTGTLDMSNISNLNSTFYAYNNTKLTQILHGPSTEKISLFFVFNCDLTGTYDLSMLSALGGNIQIYNNSNLTNILFPTTTEIFNNVGGDLNDSALALGNNDLGYVDFKPLSGATITDSGRIYLSNNNMLSSEVNQILVDFVSIATSNPIGWDYVVLYIGGTNGNPDSTSGGYDGLAAIATLTGATYNWTITY